MIVLLYGLLVTALVFLLVLPIKLLWSTLRKRRKASEKMRECANRLPEKFNEVKVGGFFTGAKKIRMKFKDRPLSLTQTGENEVTLRIESDGIPACPLLIKTRGRFLWAWTFFEWEFLPRIVTNEPLLDEGFLLYAPPYFGEYLRERAHVETSTEGDPKGMTESLVVLRRLAGVRSFILRLSRRGGFRIVFRLRNDDLLYRPEELESAAHHAIQILDELAMD